MLILKWLRSWPHFSGPQISKLPKVLMREIWRSQGSNKKWPSVKMAIQNQHFYTVTFPCSLKPPVQSLVYCSLHSIWFDTSKLKGNQSHKKLPTKYYTHTCELLPHFYTENIPPLGKFLVASLIVQSFKTHTHMYLFKETSNF